MSAPVTLVAFKVQLTRRDRDPVFHRFSGAFSYSELSTVISHLWGERPKHLVLDYTDDEGDQVRFTTEAEWQECVRIHQASGATVLRLTGKRAKDQKESKRRNRDSNGAEEPAVAPQSESDGEDEKKGEKTTGSADARRNPLDAAAALFEHAMRRAAGVCNQSPQPANVPPSVTNSPPQVECGANSAAVDLMSLMYNCDAGVELFKGATEKFGSVVKRVVNPFAPAEVHLDIDRSILYRDVVTKGNALIDAGSEGLPQAEQLLRTACVLFTDSVILEYNLACVLSLQGRLEESIELLLAARAHGYDDIQQLQTDADLANVRNHPRFVEVVPAPVAVAPTPAPAAPTPAVSAFSTTSTPAASSTTSSTTTTIPHAPPQVMTLMSIFPEMTIDEATNAMTRAGGNLARAVNSHLTSA